MDFEELKRNLIDLLDHLTSEIDEINLSQVRYFINYNELKLAIETLCEYIDEDEIVLEGSMIKRINHFCRILNIDEIYWLDSNEERND